MSGVAQSLNLLSRNNSILFLSYEQPSSDLIANLCSIFHHSTCWASKGDHNPGNGDTYSPQLTVTNWEYLVAID